MGYRVHCDWCGEVLYAFDQAILDVAVHRKADGTKLGRRWAEDRPTLHFCVAPKPDADDYNRMGLEEPDEEDTGSCFAKAMAMICWHERDEFERPDMGMEWRLVPVGERDESRNSAKPRVLAGERTATDARDEYLEHRRAWKRITSDERDRLALEMIGDDRLTITELTARFNAELPDCTVYDGYVRTIVRRLTAAGELARDAERFRKGNSIRYRYYRNSERPQPRTASRVDRD